MDHNTVAAPPLETLIASIDLRQRKIIVGVLHHDRVGGASVTIASVRNDGARSLVIIPRTRASEVVEALRMAIDACERGSGCP